MANTVALGATRAGRLTALKHEAYSSLFASGWFDEQATSTTSRLLYKADILHVAQRVVRLDVQRSELRGRGTGQDSGATAAGTSSTPSAHTSARRG